MKIDIVTIFPDIIRPSVENSIVGRAVKDGKIEVNIHNLRDFTHDRHRVVDDYPYGGGSGMVMKPDPFFEALTSLSGENSFVILMTPRGRQFSQNIARKLSAESHIIILCGHYEDIDYRVYSRCHMQLSIGDYVITGGELAAAVVVDAVTRCIPDAIKEESLEKDSFYSGIMDCSHYTRPEKIDGMRVPEILLGGNHRLINTYRRNDALRITAAQRCRLLSDTVLTYEEIDMLLEDK